MRRRLALILLLLLGGAIVNIAVAWTIAQTVNATLYTPKRIPLNGSLLWPRSNTWWTLNYLSMPGYASIWAFEQTGGPMQRQIDLDQLPAWSRFREQHLGAASQYLHLPMWAEYAWGWPTHSLTQRQEADYATGTQISYGTINMPLRKPTATVPRSNEEFLPVGVIIPGFAINTIFYAAVLWLMFAIPFALRRRRRIKRNLCPACAYPVGTSPVCTECGAAVKRRSAPHSD